MRWKFYLCITLLTISAFFFAQLIVNQHEWTHYEIYKIFGYNSTVHVGFLQSYVQLTGNQTLNENDSRNIRSLQSVVELESYQLQAFYFGVITLLIVILILVDSYFFKFVQVLDLVQRFEEMQKAKKLADEVRK